MHYTDTTVNNLVINVLTQEQYDDILNPSDSELYLITDEDAITAGTGLSTSTVDNTTVINHANSVTPQTTLAVYPTTIDSEGHISAYGSAVTIPSKTSDLINDSGFITSSPVTSVNSKTGDVTLTASDVGAMPSSYTAPVTSVNGATGTPKTSFYVTITGDSATGYTADKAFDQVAAAYEAGYAVYAINGLSILSLSMVRYSEEQISNISFSRTGGSQIYTFTWAKNSNNIAYSSINISNYVPTSRTINNKALTSNITLTASDVGALPDSTVIPAAQVQSDWNAMTGMGVILNKPTIPTVPTNVSSFTNDAGYLTLATLPIYNGEVS